MEKDIFNSLFNQKEKKDIARMLKSKEKKHSELFSIKKTRSRLRKSTHNSNLIKKFYENEAS